MGSKLNILGGPHRYTMYGEAHLLGAHMACVKCPIYTHIANLPVVTISLEFRGCSERKLVRFLLLQGNCWIFGDTGLMDKVKYHQQKTSSNMFCGALIYGYITVFKPMKVSNFLQFLLTSHSLSRKQRSVNHSLQPFVSENMRGTLKRQKEIYKAKNFYPTLLQKDHIVTAVWFCL